MKNGNKHIKKKKRKKKRYFFGHDTYNLFLVMCAEAFLIVGGGSKNIDWPRWGGGHRHILLHELKSSGGGELKTKSGDA